MNWEQDYQKKLVTVEEAAGVVKSGDRMWFGAIMSSPVDLGNALCKRYKELEDVTLFSGLALYPFEFLRGYCKGHLNYKCLFQGPLERKFAPEGNIEVTSYNFSSCDWITRNIIKPNIAVFEVSPPDERGYMSFGPIGTYNGYLISQLASTVIVQVNRETPYIPGSREAFLHVSEVDYICEKDHKLVELPNPPISEEDRKIAEFIAEQIPDGACLQAGLGGIPNAVCELLDNKKDLGVHAEMICDGIVTLAEKGIINCSKKNYHYGRIVTPMGPGCKSTYDFMNKNQLMEMYPISYVNNVNVIGRNDNIMSINGALMVDLTGQVCSESIGFDMFSGTGGQLDFVLGAGLSRGGKSFLALHSAQANKENGVKSRILTKLPPGTVVTVPRSVVHHVVTEYGIVDLRQKSIPERVRLMVSIAHPDVREDLLREAKEVGLLRD